MSEFNIDSSSIQGDEDLLRPLPLDEDQDLQPANEATVLTEGQQLNSELCGRISENTLSTNELIRCSILGLSM
jgi:hypothetical protein